MSTHEFSAAVSRGVSFCCRCNVVVGRQVVAVYGRRRGTGGREEPGSGSRWRAGEEMRRGGIDREEELEEERKTDKERVVEMKKEDGRGRGRRGIRKGGRE